MIRHIWWKEVRAGLYTWKSLFWLPISSLILSFTSYLLLTDKELSLLDQTELLWLLSKVVIGVAFLIATIDASTIVTSEFENGTAESLFLAPLRLRDFIVGKLLAPLTLWAAVFAVAVPYMLVASAGTKLAPAFIGYVAFLGTIGIGGMIMIVFAISLLYRSSKNTLTTSFVVLLAVSLPAFFASALKTGMAARIFGGISPMENIFAALDNVLVDYHLSPLLNWQYILPLLVFDLIGLTFLLTASRRFGQLGIVRAE
jgi:ABC-type transport system involved in multi-copper enzyme maturation permease subunit